MYGPEYKGTVTVTVNLQDLTYNQKRGLKALLYDEPLVPVFHGMGKIVAIKMLRTFAQRMVKQYNIKLKGDKSDMTSLWTCKNFYEEFGE